eukprot:768790-Hanusia_phi.AAC.8
MTRRKRDVVADAGDAETVSMLLGKWKGSLRNSLGKEMGYTAFLSYVRVEKAEQTTCKTACGASLGHRCSGWACRRFCGTATRLHHGASGPGSGTAETRTARTARFEKMSFQWDSRFPVPPIRRPGPGLTRTVTGSLLLVVVSMVRAAFAARSWG